MITIGMVTIALQFVRALGLSKHSRSSPATSSQRDEEISRGNVYFLG